MCQNFEKNEWKEVRRKDIVIWPLQVFLTCEWYKEKYWGHYTWRANDHRDEDARQAYRTLLIFRESPTSQPLSKSTSTVNEFDQAQARAKSIAWNRYGYRYDADEQVR